MGLFRYILRPSIANSRELRRYVTVVTGGTVAIALGCDIVNQLAFFESWSVCFRNWAVTTVEAVVITALVASALARAQLDLYNAKRRADELSRTDPLTGLPNRRLLQEAAARGDIGAMALVIADIDRFKRVNDRHGHLIGDAVIRTVAEMIRAELADVGEVARIGGEEFALIADARNRAGLADALNRCRERIAATPIAARGVDVGVTISAGVAFAEPEQRFEDLYAAADRALYVAKAAGRNRVLFADALGDIAEPAPEERAAPFATPGAARSTGAAERVNPRAAAN